MRPEWMTSETSVMTDFSEGNPDAPSGGGSVTAMNMLPWIMALAKGSLLLWKTNT